MYIIWLKKKQVRSRSESNSTAKIPLYVQILNASRSLLKANKSRCIPEADMKLPNLVCRSLNNVSPESPNILTISNTILALLFNLKLSVFLVMSEPNESNQSKINRRRSDLRRKLSISEPLRLYLDFVPLGSPLFECRCPLQISACIRECSTHGPEKMRDANPAIRLTRCA